MSCVDVGDEPVVIYEWQGGLYEYDFTTHQIRPSWPLAEREWLLNLDCEGEVFTVVSPAGVAHRSSYALMTTLCGIDFPPSWTPLVGLVTCERCLRSRRS